MSQEQQDLSTQLQQAQDELAGLERDLGKVESELQALATQRQQYQLLEQACESLEQLREQGAAEVFWGDQSAADKAADHVLQVRGRVSGFLEVVDKIETRRRTVVEAIQNQQEFVDDLDEDLLQAHEQEERRKLEWIIERDVATFPSFVQIMPWARGGEDDTRFRKSLAGSLLAGLLLGLLIPLIELPIPEREAEIEVPERLARLIRQQQEQPLPPAKLVEEEQVPEKPPEPEPEPEEKPEPMVAEAPTQEQVPIPTPVVPKETPRERVQSKGILAFRDSISNLALSRPAAELGSRARISASGEAAIGQTERSMVTTQAPGSSGGINLASLSRDVGGGGGQQMEGVQASRIASSIDASGGSDRPRSSGALAGRTDEEIQIVFDRYKAALYRLYNRELRRDPTLRGQMLLRLTIEPDGSVSLCSLQSSDMNASELGQHVVDRVRGFEFGAKDVPAVTILYPIDFLPAA